MHVCTQQRISRVSLVNISWPTQQGVEIETPDNHRQQNNNPANSRRPNIRLPRRPPSQKRSYDLYRPCRSRSSRSSTNINNSDADRRIPARIKQLATSGDERRRDETRQPVTVGASGSRRRCSPSSSHRSLASPPRPSTSSLDGKKSCTFTQRLTPYSSRKPGGLLRMHPVITDTR